MEGRNILAVDDDEVILKLIENDLQKAGFTVIKAKGGKEAIELMGRKRPDLILLDIDIPEMSGPEIEQILRDDPDTKKIPIIYLTEIMTKEEEKKEFGHASGGNLFIAKPYDPKKLLELVKKYTE